MKTQKTDTDAHALIAALPAARRADGERLLRLFTEVTGEDPIVWGQGLIGFGRYHYRYDSGREGDFLRTGFAVRARELVVYLMPGTERYRALLDQLGPHRCGKSCLYFKRLDAVDEAVLRRLIGAALDDMKAAFQPDA